MRSANSLNHPRWECKYHIVFIPKYRRKVLFGEIRRELGEVFHRLAKQKESLIEEGHLMVDHAHMMISIPPKYAVAQVIGYIKGKSAIHIARNYSGRKRNYVGTTVEAGRQLSRLITARVWHFLQSCAEVGKASSGAP